MGHTTNTTMVYAHADETQMKVDVGKEIINWAKGQFPTIPTDAASAKAVACSTAKDAIKKQINVLSGGTTGLVSFGASLFKKEDPMDKLLNPAMKAVGC